MRQTRPSSQLVEFVISIAVGLLAILGALLCVGFLLVDPVRNPNGVGQTQPLPDYEGTCIHIHTHTYIHTSGPMYQFVTFLGWLA